MNKLKINNFLFKDLLHILLFIFSYVKIKKDYQYLISILEHLDTDEEKI